MNALSKLFEVLHLSRGEMTLRRSHHRRRARRQESSLSCETLEPKQLLAADVAVQFSDIVLDATSPTTVAIEGKFADTAVSGTVVKFETNAPLSDNDFYIELTDNTPLTNANFLSYVNSGAYDNSEFHRSVSDFVIQGGGFKHPTVAADQPGSDPVAISTTGTVQNEPGNLNTRGTIAMAKLGGQPDSATSQFFFNLSDNSFLDSDNGGYTQFGSVLGSGMTVVDTMGSALTYDATTYYSNSALSDLPLWNVNQDNIVRPQDFVQIENADVVTESALFTYSASSSDSAKLTAAFNSNGDLVLTPVGSAAGTIDVIVTATSRLDNSTATDVFSVGLSGGENPDPGGNPDPGIELTAIESNGTTVLNRDATGKLYAGDQPIFYNGVQIDVTRFPNYTLVGAEDFGSNGGKQVLFAKTDGIYSLWSMTSSWAFQSNTIINANDTSAINAALVKFGLADPAPTLFAIEEVGNTVLNKDQDGKLYAGDQPLYYGTTQLTETYFAAYTPVAVEDFGDGDKRFVLKHSTGSLLTFTMSATWTRTGNLPWIETDDPTAFNTAEREYGVDFDDDGNTGLIFTPIETAGSTALRRDQSGRLYAGSQPIYLSGTTQLTETYFAAYTPVAVEDFGDGDKRFVLKHSTGSLLTFTMSSTWTRTGNLPWIEVDDSAAFNTAEVEYGLDFDGDA